MNNTGIFYAKNKHTSKITLTLLVIVSMFIILWLAIEVRAENEYALCSTLCEIAEADPIYYADYEKGSPEYWNTYCNQMLNTKAQCK